jgi:hypothetical protein
MNTGALDPLLHHPGRLRFVATLAALPDGDALSVSRLRDTIGLPISSPIAGHPDPDGRLRCSPGSARSLHEPDHGSAVGGLLLVGDLEAEGLIERDVAGGAGFQEGGASVGPGQIQAVCHQCPA